MENNNPADRGGQRHGAEHADGIATIHCLEKIPLQILIGAIETTGIPAITSLETIVCIYTMLRIIGQLLILKMGRQDTNPRFQFTSALIAVVLGCVRCCLLMCIPLRVMPWPIFILYVLELINPLAFIAQEGIVTIFSVFLVLRFALWGSWYRCA